MGVDITDLQEGEEEGECMNYKVLFKYIHLFHTNKKDYVIVFPKNLHFPFGS